MSKKIEPEVHFIGQIIGTSNFDISNAFCKYDIKTNENWIILDGDSEGQTQTDYPTDELYITWNHPIDIHYFTTSIQGWPKLLLEIWTLDENGAREINGYSYLPLPTEAGHHKLSTPVWRPGGNWREEVASYFIGGAPQLKNKNLLYKSAKDERIRITSTPVGNIHLEIDVMLRNFNTHDIRWN